MNTLTSSMVRGLKGAPASIILLLMCVGQPVSNAWLAANSGFTDKPIALGLAYLKELGLVIHVLGGWRLSGDLQQLPFLLPIQDNLTSTSRIHSDSVGSSSGLNIKESYIHTTTTTESDSFRLPNIIDCVQALINLGGIGPDAAEDAVGRAIDRGDEPATILARIAASDKYSQSQSTIHSKGGFAARLVAGGYDPAAVPVAPPAEPAEPDEPPEPATPDEPAPPAAPLTAAGELWLKTLAVLRMEIPKSTYDTWMASTRLVEGAQGQAAYVVQCASLHAKTWIENRMAKAIGRDLAHVAGHEVTVTFEVVSQEEHHAAHP